MNAPESALDVPDVADLTPQIRPRRRFWQTPDPFVGIALAAAAGILAADWLDGDPWTALGLFLMVSLFWAWRPGPSSCWLTIAAAFAALHGFRLHAPPAETLARFLPTPQSVHAIGTVLDEPKVSDSHVARFSLGLERIEFAGHAWPCRARVLTYWKHGAPACGDRLDLLGEARNIPGPRNPGEFDFADYQRRQGIRSQISCSGVTDVRITARQTSGFKQTAVRFHDWMRDTLGLGIDPETPTAAIISTMLLGLREDPGLGDQEELFQRTGTLHYFAIDGLKLALLSGLVLWGLQRARVPRIWGQTLCLPLLVFYAMATGLGPASVRATLIAGIVLGAFWIDRAFRPLNSLGAAAAAILFYDSNQLFDLGFQLTFAVVIAIILFAGPVHRRLTAIGAPDPFLPPRLFSPTRAWAERARYWGWGLVSVSLIAWAGSLPIMILRFHVISPVSPLANVVTFPLAWTVLALGVAALGAAPVAALVNRANAFAAKLFLVAAQAFDATPGGSFYVPAPSYWTAAAPPAAELTVLDLDVARAIHLRVGSADWLIDAAQPFEYARSVRPYLRARGVNRLSGLILSQADNRHLGAAPLAWADFRPRQIIDSSPLPGRSPRRQEFLELVGERNVQILPQGQRLELASGAELRALYPPPGMKSGAAADRALVMQLRAAGWRVLLMANAGAAVERWLVGHVPAEQLRSDAVVTGAPAAEWEHFFGSVAPALVISQSIPEETSARSSIKVMHTALSGAVRLQIRASQLVADGFADGSRFVTTSPAAESAPRSSARPPLARR